jgi:amino acid transporter
VALVINSIIGAGIFGLPSRIFALAGTYSLFAYLLSAVAIGLVILCFAEVGSRFSATGVCALRVVPRDMLVRLMSISWNSVAAWSL